MLAKIAVADFMTTNLVTVTPNTEISQAIKRLLDHKITSMPVVDERGKLLGVFSEKDGMKIFVESAYNQSMEGKVGEFMSHEPLSINADASLVDVATQFQHAPIRSFPVLQNGELVGIISRVDVMRALVGLR
jgi:CBS domain-containing protein